MALGVAFKILVVALILQLVNAGKPDRRHVTIHIPYKVKHIVHTHTVLKHIEKEHPEENYEVLGYSYGKPEEGHSHGAEASNLGEGAYGVELGHDLGGAEQDYTGAGHNFEAGGDVQNHDWSSKYPLTAEGAGFGEENEGYNYNYYAG